MKKEWRDKWIVALRSGKYEQIQKRLRTEYGFCCLGVACDISGLGLWIKNGIDVDEYMINHDYTSTVLPRPVAKLFGMGRDCKGEMEIGDDIILLTTLNDNGFTFNQIADMIEWYWSDEFCTE